MHGPHGYADDNQNYAILSSRRQEFIIHHRQRKNCHRRFVGIVQKVFSEKASAIARMRQKCVRNASKMRQNGSCFIGKRGTFQNAADMRQNCVKNASKMRGTPLGEDTFWTIPTLTPSPAPVMYKISGPMGGGFDTPLALTLKTLQ